MSVDAATVKRIGRLARIRIEEGEVESYRNELNAILGFVEQLAEVDVAGDSLTGSPRDGAALLPALDRDRESSRQPV